MLNFKEIENKYELENENENENKNKNINEDEDEEESIIKTTYQCENSDEENNIFKNKENKIEINNNNIKKTHYKSKSYNDLLFKNENFENESRNSKIKKIPSFLNNQTIKYQNEIIKLKQQIKNLEEQNEILEIKINEEEERNSSLESQKKIKDKTNEEIIFQIQNYLNLNSKEEIIPHLKEMIIYIKENSDSIDFLNKEAKLRDELIEKLEGLYLTLTGSEKKENENIEINILWKWVKHLVNILDELNQEKENNILIYQEINHNDVYKNFCSEMLNEFNLDSIDNLKEYINNLLMESNINERRVEKIKKCLMNGNTKIEYNRNLNKNNKNNE